MLEEEENSYGVSKFHQNVQVCAAPASRCWHSHPPRANFQLGVRANEMTNKMEQTNQCYGTLDIGSDDESVCIDQSGRLVIL